MANGATNAFDVIGALKGIADAIPTLQHKDIAVVVGHTQGDPPKRYFRIGRVDWERSDWATNRSREERMNVNVQILVSMAGASAQDALDEVERLSKEFEQAIKANPSLGLPAVVSSDVVPRELDSAPSDGVWVAGIDYEVRVTARL